MWDKSLMVGMLKLSVFTSYERVCKATERMPTKKRDAIMENWRNWLWGYKRTK